MPVPSPSGWERRRQLLLGEYERVALELFAARGFRNVTVEAIADAAGVSARTLFRYFPTKEDFLLAFPRRGAAAAVEIIDELEASDAPLATSWLALRQYYAETLVDVDLLTLWRKAAADAPDVHAQVRGERTEALIDALTRYCARALGTDDESDARPRLIAGIVAGLEFALIELYGRSEATLPELLDAADRLVLGLDGSVAPR